MTTLRADARNLNWLIDNFVERVPGVLDALVVSADGLLMAMSEGLDRATADQVAAVTAGLQSLTQGAARMFDGGAVRQVIVDMERGFMFVTAISDGSSLAVIAEANCDIGLVGYEMALMVTRAEAVLSPALVAELRTNLPR